MEKYWFSILGFTPELKTLVFVVYQFTKPLSEAEEKFSKTLNAREDEVLS